VCIFIFRREENLYPSEFWNCKLCRGTSGEFGFVREWMIVVLTRCGCSSMYDGDGSRLHGVLFYGIFLRFFKFALLIWLWIFFRIINLGGMVVCFGMSEVNLFKSEVLLCRSVLVYKLWCVLFVIYYICLNRCISIFLLFKELVVL
jgi:hypothetical protein